MDTTKWIEIQSMDGLHARLFIPENQNEPLPVFVFLHGSSERGDDNQKQLIHIAPYLSSDTLQSIQACILLFPQCPEDDYWAPIDIIDGQWLTKTASDPTPIMKKLIRFLDSIHNDPRVDPSRIYISGLSMGGFGTWDLLSRKPELFAAGIPICGGGDPTKVESYSDVPIWAFHGTEDAIVPVELTRKTVNALKHIGSDILYTEFPGVSHHSWDLAIQYPGLLEWLFSKSK